MNTVETAKDLDIHVILDNYATHKHPKVKRPPSSAITPTSASSLNLVDGSSANSLSDNCALASPASTVDPSHHRLHHRPFRQILKKVHKANEMATLH